jgi:hypothetical protein
LPSPDCTLPLELNLIVLCRLSWTYLPLPDCILPLELNLLAITWLYFAAWVEFACHHLIVLCRLSW